MKRSKGFTMTELALVITIMITLAGFLAPHFHQGFRGISIDAAVQETVTAMNFARQAAITMRDEVQLVTSRGSRSISVVNIETGDTLKVFTLPPQTEVRGRGGGLICYPRGVADAGGIRVTNGDEDYRIRLTPTARTKIRAL